MCGRQVFILNNIFHKSFSPVIAICSKLHTLLLCSRACDDATRMVLQCITYNHHQRINQRRVYYNFALVLIEIREWNTKCLLTSWLNSNYRKPKLGLFCSRCSGSSRTWTSISCRSIAIGCGRYKIVYYLVGTRMGENWILGCRAIISWSSSSSSSSACPCHWPCLNNPKCTWMMMLNNCVFESH